MNPFKSTFFVAALALSVGTSSLLAISASASNDEKSIIISPLSKTRKTPGGKTYPETRVVKIISRVAGGKVQLQFLVCDLGLPCAEITGRIHTAPDTWVDAVKMNSVLRTVNAENASVAAFTLLTGGIGVLAGIMTGGWSTLAICTGGLLTSLMGYAIASGDRDPSGHYTGTLDAQQCTRDALGQLNKGEAGLQHSSSKKFDLDDLITAIKYAKQEASR